MTISVNGVRARITASSGRTVQTAGPFYSASATDQVIQATRDGAIIYGNDLGNTILLLNGASYVEGGSGPDVIIAGNGSQSLYGHDGNDVIVTGTGPEVAFGGAGDDVLIIGGAGGTQSFDGGPGYDTLVAGGLRRQYALDPSISKVTATEFGNIADGLSLVGPNAADGLANIEAIQFLDGTMQIGPNSEAADITRLYQSILGRAPDADGLTSWVQSLHGGTALRAIANAMLSSPESQAQQGGASDAAYVTQVYQASLGRAPDPSGLAGWTSQLASGATTRADIAVGISQSAEAQALSNTAGAKTLTWIPDEQAASVARLYDTALGRTPDTAGLTYWITALEGTPMVAPTLNLHDMAVAFMASPEFQASYGNTSDQSFVQLVYNNTLHRAPDAPGAAFWQKALASGADRASVLIGFSESAEHRSMLSAPIEAAGIVTT